MSVFVVDQDGELVRDRRGFTRTSGLDAIAQDLRLYLRLRQGEIPTRQDLGLPWEPMLAQAVPDATLAQVVGERGVKTRPGVVSHEVTVETDGAARTAVVSYVARVSLEDQRRRSVLTGEVSVLV